MPYEPLEAIIERMKADALFRTELMTKEDVAERMELIFSEMLCLGFHSSCSLLFPIMSYSLLYPYNFPIYF